MENQNQFSKTNEKPKTCIIYTRANHDAGHNLLSQRETCEQFAAAHGINVIQHFEGYAGDTQREFERMIAFAKANAQRLNYILVSALDRFSRAGIAAITLSAELQQRYGIRVLSANERFTDSSYDEFMSYIQLLLPALDKSISREKILAGKRKRALRGEWAGVPPRGYEVTGSGRNVRLSFTSEAQLIKEAFVKRSEEMSVSTLRDWLSSKGFYIANSRLHSMLRNCFYAGYIKSVYVPGKLIRGTHPPIIDAETFFLINQINEGDEIIENLNS
jgi:DNA invertase Pin-like site-specific DNA recombinase